MAWRKRLLWKSVEESFCYQKDGRAKGWLEHIIYYQLNRN